MQSNRQKLKSALARFQEAALVLDRAWSPDDGDAIVNYSTGIGSFDEFAAEVQEWAVRPPDWSHDQLAALGTIAHEASIGAYGITDGITAFRATGPTHGAEPGDMVVIVTATDGGHSDTPGRRRRFIEVVKGDGKRESGSDRHEA